VATRLVAWSQPTQATSTQKIRTTLWLNFIRAIRDTNSKHYHRTRQHHFASQAAGRPITEVEAWFPNSRLMEAGW
jgi:hypothetical protein